jgi:hypothetical protein
LWAFSFVDESCTGDYNTPNVGNSLGETVMNLFRVMLMTTTVKHTEDLPFETFDLASEYAQSQLKAYNATYYHIDDLGEAIKLKIEVTDTYGGEANYAWVKRHELWVSRFAPSRECIRLAKAKAGWTGVICRTASYGDSWKLIPSKMLQVMFISIEE